MAYRPRPVLGHGANTARGSGGPAYTSRENADTATTPFSNINSLRREKGGKGALVWGENGDGGER